MHAFARNKRSARHIIKLSGKARRFAGKLHYNFNYLSGNNNSARFYVCIRNTIQFVTIPLVVKQNTHTHIEKKQEENIVSPHLTKIMTKAGQGQYGEHCAVHSAPFFCPINIIP